MTKLKFWNLEYPFKDFLLISSKKELLEETLYKLNRKFNEMNLNIQHLNRYGQVNNYIVSGDKCINDKKIIFSGMSVYKNKFYFGENDLDDNIDKDFIHSTGMFTTININSENLIIGQDFFGCGNLFYAEYDDAIYISNRYHLLLLTLAKMGFKGELDKAKVLYWIYFYYSELFIRNSHANMDIKNVYNLPINKYILINEEGWSLNEKEEIDYAIRGITNNSYNETLDLGINDIYENIKSIANNYKFNKYIIDISGGFDSRVTLAASNKLKSNFIDLQAYINNTSVKGDLEIGNGLRKLLNIPLYKEDVEKNYPISLEEALFMWRSYFMGNYHSLGIGAWSNKNKNLGAIRLTGGIGECYRAKYLKGGYGKLLKLDNSSIDRFVENLVNYDNKFLKLDRDINLVYDLFKNTMESYVIGDTIEDKLENFYTIFNSRNHFGMNAYDTYNNIPTYHVLMSKNLLTASRILDAKERFNERFMLELTERISSILAWAPYENKEIDTHHILNNINLKHNNLKNYNVKLDYDTKDWELQKKNNIEYLNSLRKLEKYNLSSDFYEQWRDLSEFLRSEIIKNYHILCNYMDIYSVDFMNYISDEEISDSKVRVIYSKIISLLDQINIFE